MTRVGVRIPMASGFAVAAGGMLLLSAVSRDGSYVGDLKVEKVRPKESGGKLVTLVQTVQTGDRVAHGLTSN